MGRALPFTHHANLVKIRERLRELRMERGMSQAQLAEMLGYHYTAICRFETGKFEDIMFSTIDRWATAVGAKVEYKIKVADRPTRVDFLALKRTLRDAQLANPKTEAGARMQAESRARSLEKLAHERGYRPPRKETS